MKKQLLSLLLILFWAAPFRAAAQDEAITWQKQGLQVSFDDYALRELIPLSDPYRANILDENGRLGNVDVRYQIGPGDWLSLYTGARELTIDEEANTLTYLDSIEGMPFMMEQTFSFHNRQVEWTIRLKNMKRFPVKIGDLAIPLRWNRPSADNQADRYEKGFTKHHFISEDGSFLYFTKGSGKPPYCLMTVQPGTKLEYFSSGGDSYKAYIHSGLSGNAVQRGTWRQPHTYGNLSPAGEEGDEIIHRFRIQWAESYDELRELVYQNRLIDIRVVPGMTVPRDLNARFSLHTLCRIDSIVPEFPAQTNLQYQGEKKKDHHLYRVEFEKLGENKLTVYFDGNRRTHLEFFSTEPLETLVKKRSAFIVNKQQHRKPSKWYDGLFSVYDMKNSVLRGPDNPDGFTHWWGYVLACDDPALGKAPYVASKNVVYPNKQEIEALEYYLENFVWGGLQRTNQEEPYPYGIYGTPNWKVNRDPLLRAGVKNRNLDKMNVWRSYDYPHMFMLYYHMHEIAAMYPQLTSYLDAAGYLERAWQTAKAFFTYPYELLTYYETYQWGFYNELVLLDIIDALEREGHPRKAEWLRKEWEKKVKYFVYDDPYPYRSEYPFDRTAYESSYALAKYGATHNMPTDTNLWYNKKLNKWYSHSRVRKEDARRFMDEQLKANLACRGWLEAKYFLLGSDFTTSSDGHCLSYMARMGGWGILDYGMRFAEEPWDWLQLGYASYLSSFALMNTGTPESNYGYWYPGEENDGATGWAFNAAKHGRAWIRKDVPRGAWFYDGEADLGYGAIKRSAATLLTRDPLFGWLAYGGRMEENTRGFRVWPRDGMNIRFGVVLEDKRTLFELNRDGISRSKPIQVDKDLKQIAFTLENRSQDKHHTRIQLKTDHKPGVYVDERPVPVVPGHTGWNASIPVNQSIHTIKIDIP